MDSFSDSGELYLIRYQFYTNQHEKVTNYNLEDFSPENQLKVLEYIIRSTIELNLDASNLIENGRSIFPDDLNVFQVLQAWNDLHDFGTDDSTYFEDLKEAKFELQAILTTFYLVKFEKDLNQAIIFLNDYLENLNISTKYNEIEIYLILIQLNLIRGNYSNVKKIFMQLNQFPEFVKDNIIYQIIESWVKSIQNGNENLNNCFYFYDEILNNSFNDDDIKGKIHNLIILFILNLQLKHYPESQEILKQIENIKLDYEQLSKENDNNNSIKFKDDELDNLLANQITLDRLINFGNESEKLLEELKKINGEHELIKDEASKNELFDSIVTKYQTTAV
ncbi:uncharacterized protein KGF55_002086 [Candida pseudojiufengensis]|uniref:uncharacterized protein n=1 Tax=Candida pseudojiufengensis TaxID=497109 RepID=UPI002223F0F6|nr:uncharacterized protein KGF55_002086 [Candida pseudojiufengensis]KAI5964144.1 hypothetical protein KGF55_002086 [Candida pseudojiufengensis]